MLGRSLSQLDTSIVLILYILILYILVLYPLPPYPLIPYTLYFPYTLYTFIPFISLPGEPFPHYPVTFKA